MTIPKHIVGICGGSGSGKTTLVNILFEKLSDHNSISLLSLDNYYKEKHLQYKDDNGIYNFDLPSALYEEDIIRDVYSLKQGKTIEREEYNYNVGVETPTLIKVEPADILLVEGLFVFHNPEIKDLLTTKVFIDVNPEKQLQRRLQRDVNERGYSEDQIVYQWENHVVPCFNSYLNPHKEDADFIISNDAYFEKGVNDLVDHLSH